VVSDQAAGVSNVFGGGETVMENPTVTVVFPAYNEEENIQASVEDFLAQECVDEVLVINNNSTDRTPELVKETGATLVNEDRQGYGYAVRKGLESAEGDYVVTAEPDGTFVGKDVRKLLAYADDFEMVCGTRTTKELIWDNANMGWFLRLGNIVVAKMIQLLFGGPSLSDCGCTMRLIRQDALEEIQEDLTVGDSHFLPEMVILALLDDISLIEIPLNYRERVGSSKITGELYGTFKTGFNMIALTLSYFFARKLFG
jgi:glycosyltransferase involved in cell wall biosynthesis